jgi:hypothetical protein
MEVWLSSAAYSATPFHWESPLSPPNPSVAARWMQPCAASCSFSTTQSGAVFEDMARDRDHRGSAIVCERDALAAIAGLARPMMAMTKAFAVIQRSNICTRKQRRIICLSNKSPVLPLEVPFHTPSPKKSIYSALQALACISSLVNPPYGVRLTWPSPHLGLSHYPP